jgi:hypothetical protein
MHDTSGGEVLKKLMKNKVLLILGIRYITGRTVSKYQRYY